MTLRDITDQIDWLVASQPPAEAMTTLRQLGLWAAERYEDERGLTAHAELVDA